MKTYNFAWLFGIVALLGCSNRPAAAPSKAATFPDVLDLDRELSDPFIPLEPEKPAREDRRRPTPPAPTPAAPRTGPIPFAAEGTFSRSGWMGDAENPTGPLKYELCRSSPSSEPTCDKWIYGPPTPGEMGWIAVAYQGPKPNNWGNFRGADLHGKGYTRLTFMARGEQGGERVVVTSGGHTPAGAQFPASYEATLGMITLERTWKAFDLEFPSDTDLSNICSIFSFSINRSMAPEGCVIYFDDIVLCGDTDQ